MLSLPGLTRLLPKLFNRTSQAEIQRRSVWLTYTDSDVLNSHRNIQSAVKQLASLGFNTLYPVVWQRGYSLYPSQVAEQTFGASTLPNSPFVGRDFLAELLPIAKASGFRVIPWFEYGLMAPPGSALAQQHPDWLSQKANGEKLHNGMVWLNPAYPEARAFITDLIAELVSHYDVDGIQLDDHFGWPSALGHDAFTQALYRQHGSELPRPNERNWITWRMARVTDLMQQINQRVKAAKPNCLISLSPNPYSFSLQHYLTDWQRWLQADLIDELVIQLYRDSLPSLEAELLKPELVKARRKIPVSVGLLAGLRTKSVSLKRLQQQVATVQRHGFTGISFFFYETLMHETLSPQAVGDRDKLKRLFI